MDEKTEYLDGDVVWVKLSNCWWPGEVCGESRLPEGLLASMKRQPIAVVRFFQEDTFEYVKSLNDIFKYNCIKKFEFIKRGLEQHRAKKKYMDKFPADVSTAEKLTGGNPEIINDQQFQPQKRESYAEIFQDAKRSPKSKRVSKPSISSVSPVKTSSKMHYLLSSPSTKTEHEKRFMEQSPPSSYVAASTSSSVSSFGSGTPTASYNCYKCGYTSGRQNVIIMHLKSCSGTISQSVPAKNKKKPIVTNTEVKIITKPKVVKPIKARNLEIDFDLDAEMESEQTKTRMRRSIAPMAVAPTPIRKRSRKTRPDEIVAIVEEKDKPKEPVLVVPEEKPQVKENVKKHILDDWSEDDVDEDKKETETLIISAEKSKEAETPISAITSVVDISQSKVNEVNNVVPVAHNTIKYRNIPKKQKREYVEVNNDDEQLPVIEPVTPTLTPTSSFINNEKIEKVPIPYVSPSLRPISAKERILNRATGRNSSSYEMPQKPVELNEKPVEIKDKEESKTVLSTTVEVKSIVDEVKLSPVIPTTEDIIPMPAEEMKSVLPMDDSAEILVPPIQTEETKPIQTLPTEETNPILPIPTEEKPTLPIIATNNESTPPISTNDVESIFPIPINNVEPILPLPTEEEKPVTPKEEEMPIPPIPTEEEKPLPPPPAEEPSQSGKSDEQKKEISCFDFKEEDEDETFVLSKSPRRSLSNRLSSGTTGGAIGSALTSSTINNNETIDDKELERKDDVLKSEIESLLCDTSVPKLPEIPKIAALTVATDRSPKDDVDRDRKLPPKERGKRIFKSRNRATTETDTNSAANIGSATEIVTPTTDKKEIEVCNSEYAAIKSKRTKLSEATSEENKEKGKEKEKDKAKKVMEKEKKEKEKERENEDIKKTEKETEFEPEVNNEAIVEQPKEGELVDEKPSVIENKDIQDTKDNQDIKETPKKGRRIKQQKPALVTVKDIKESEIDKNIEELSSPPPPAVIISTEDEEEIPQEIPQIVPTITIKETEQEENQISSTSTEIIPKETDEDKKPKIIEVQSVNLIEEEKPIEKKEKIKEVLPEKSPKSRRRKSKSEREENSKKAKVIEDDMHLAAEALIKLPDSAPNQESAAVASSAKKKIMNPRKRHLLQAEEESKRPKIQDEKLFDITSMEVVIEKEADENVKRPNVQNSNGSTSAKTAQLFQASSGGQIVITSKGTLMTTQSQVLTTTCDKTPMITTTQLLTTTCSTVCNSSISSAKSKIKSPAKIKVQSNQIIHPAISKPSKEEPSNEASIVSKSTKEPSNNAPSKLSKEHTSNPASRPPKEQPSNTASFASSIKDETRSTSIDDSVTSSPEPIRERSSSKSSASASATSSGRKKEGTKMSPQQIKELQKMGYVETKGKSKVFTQSAIKKMQQQNILPPSSSNRKLEPNLELDLSEPVQIDEITPVTTTTTTTSAIITEVEAKSDDDMMMIVDESKLIEEDVEMEEEEATSMSQLEESDSSSVQDSSQLIAVPAENFGGPANLFYLCSVVDDAYVPLNNKLLYLDSSNQLVALPDSAAADIIGQPDILEIPASEQIISTDEVGGLGGESSQQGFLLNTQDGQQIILDQQSLIALAAGSDASQLLTQDGQQILLQGSAQELLAALAVNQPGIGIVAADGSQILVSPDSLIDLQSQDQDILATALANNNTEVEIIPSEIIQTHHQNTTIETNAILTKPPIMSAVEVPSSKKADIPLKSSNLDDSLAAIGVSAHSNVPTSLELPITVTNPIIAKTTTAKINQIYPTTTVTPTAMAATSLVSVVDQSDRLSRCFKI